MALCEMMAFQPNATLKSNAARLQNSVPRVTIVWGALQGRRVAGKAHVICLQTNLKRQRG